MLMAAFVCLSGIIIAAGLLSSIAGIFLTNQLTAGLYRVLLLRIRGQPVRISEGFRGFGPRFWQLTLCQLIQSGVSLGFGLLLVAGLAPPVLLALGTTSGSLNPPLWTVIVLFVLGTGVALAATVFLFYFLISWMYAPPLILDKGLDYWPAMKLSRQVVNRHPWHFSVVLLIISTFAFVGLLAFGIGVIVTGTVSALMLATVYEDMFGDLAPVAETPGVGGPREIAKN